MARKRRKGSQGGYSPRRTNFRNTRQRFLIYCEGKQTEPNYFNSFHVGRKVRGFGCDPLTLVEKTIRSRDVDEYDQVWCVFDRNSHSAEKIRDAFILANQEGIQVAYSNQSFEIWYLLHFQYIDTVIDRNDCYQKLSDLLGFEYDKNNDELYELLKDKQPQAMAHAKRLQDQFASQDPVYASPYTTVHLLVEQLNKFIQ